MKHIFFIVSFELNTCGADTICHSLTELSKHIARCQFAAKKENLNGAINIHLYNKDKYPKSIFKDEDSEMAFFDNYFNADKNILKSILFDYR